MVDVSKISSLSELSDALRSLASQCRDLRDTAKKDDDPHYRLAATRYDVAYRQLKALRLQVEDD